MGVARGVLEGTEFVAVIFGKKREVGGWGVVVVSIEEICVVCRDGVCIIECVCGVRG